jgi:hypothetical protein
LLQLGALQRAGAGASLVDEHQAVVALHRRVNLVRSDIGRQRHAWRTRAPDEADQHPARRIDVVRDRDSQR